MYQNLHDLLEDAALDIAHVDLSCDLLPPEEQALGEQVCRCLRQMQEVYHFTEQLADGDLHVEPPERGNYYAGPLKDVYYKLKHLTWQAIQVAKGDYTQQVDFLGEFSQSFNYMIHQLATREEQLEKNSRERIADIERQNRFLRSELDRQFLFFQSYREYTDSFQKFREEYKLMMGQVYDLFQSGRYEEGRHLIAKINDQMGSMIQVHRDYSNHEYVNAALMNVANFCRDRGIGFYGRVYIPETMPMHRDVFPQLLANLSGLVLTLLETPGHAEQDLEITSAEKPNWLVISVRYEAKEGFAKKGKSPVNPDCNVYLRNIRELEEKIGGFLDEKIDHEAQTITYCILISAEEAVSEEKQIPATKKR